MHFKKNRFKWLTVFSMVLIKNNNKLIDDINQPTINNMYFYKGLIKNIFLDNHSI